MSNYLYRVWCTDENKWINLWTESETDPTTCPTNEAHVIDQTKTQLITVDLEKRDRWGKIRNQSSPRPLSHDTFFTSRCDDSSTPYNVGGGALMELTHNIGDPFEQSAIYDFNCVMNPTFLFNGICHSVDAIRDLICLEIIPRVTETTPSQDTNYMLINDYLIIPANGNGNIDIVSNIQQHDGGLVRCPISDLGIEANGFWDATWNPTTNLYENITPCPNGDGSYNMFSKEITFKKFINDMIIGGSSTFDMHCMDISEMTHGIRIKITIKTRGVDHRWWVGFDFKLFRKLTT